MPQRIIIQEIRRLSIRGLETVLNKQPIPAVEIAHHRVLLELSTDLDVKAGDSIHSAELGAGVLIDKVHRQVDEQRVRIELEFHYEGIV